MSERLDETNERLGELRERVDETNERLTELRDRQTATEVRLATEMGGVAGAVREVRDLLREDRALPGRVDDHERRISAIEGQTGYATAASLIGPRRGASSRPLLPAVDAPACPQGPRLQLCEEQLGVGVR